MSINKLVIPCLKGRIGDEDDAWFFYCGLMTFDEIAKRVKLPKEIDKKYGDQDLKLGEWIQRDLAPERTKRIVEYINSQPQRFFNSLILGIFDGKPYWQELNITKATDEIDGFDEVSYKYFSESIGVLTLEGSESIFAIDGQHRAIGIREAVKNNSKINKDEIPVIFVAHKMTNEGNVRTRRLFSTLNRYAKPVDKSEIIALSEDDNCAIITRELIDNFDLLKDRIIVNKSPSINPSNTKSFTNIRTLYDIIERILTDKKVYNIEVKGQNNYQFVNKRLDDEKIVKLTKELKKTLTDSLTKIPSFKAFIDSGAVDRNDKKTNLIFRPIGQNIFFDVIKVAKDKNKLNSAIKYFSKDSFNLSNPIWKSILWDSESNNITTQKTKVRFAALLIIEHLGIELKKTKKDLDLFSAFNIDPTSI